MLCSYTLSYYRCILTLLMEFRFPGPTGGCAQNSNSISSPIFQQSTGVPNTHIHRQTIELATSIIIGNIYLMQARNVTK